MENASKALMMAAGVLIGILILSLAVYLFSSFATTSGQIQKQNAQVQLEQFNAQYTSYEAKDITIYDAISIANMATENNRYYNLDKKTVGQNLGKDNYISIVFKGIAIEYGINSNMLNAESTYNNMIKTEIASISSSSTALPQYSVKTSISLTTKRVYKVEIILK